ncbi:MAG: GNAT family N-acetyltransferase [Saprospiraceae bacterium]
MYSIVSLNLQHDEALFRLYQKVAAESGGIIRVSSEITPAYVSGMLHKCVQQGLIFGIFNPAKPFQLIAEIHTYTPDIQAFRHLLTDLTVVVHPDFQGKGLGKLIFEHLLNEIKRAHPHILRVELFVRENNAKAVEFYQRLGFIEQGRHRHKIKNADGSLETPIEMAWFNPAYQDLE